MGKRRLQGSEDSGDGLFLNSVIGHLWSPQDEGYHPGGLFASVGQMGVGFGNAGNRGRGRTGATGRARGRGRNTSNASQSEVTQNEAAIPLGTSSNEIFSCIMAVLVVTYMEDGGLFGGRVHTTLYSPKLHSSTKKYLSLYTNEMPASIRLYVAKNRNDEDIATSFIATGAPPIWVKACLNWYLVESSFLLVLALSSNLYDPPRSGPWSINSWCGRSYLFLSFQK